MNRVGKSFFVSLVVSFAVGLVFYFGFSGGFFFMLGFLIAEIIQLIILFDRSAREVDILSEALLSYVSSPLTDDDYVEISIETKDNRKLTKMIKVTDFDDVVDSLKKQDVKILSASEYIMRANVSKESIDRLQEIVDK